MNTRLIAVLVMTLCTFVSSVSLAGPSYANKESQRIIEKMVEAHGGLQKWQSAPAISFDNIMHNNYHQKNEFAWWVAHETIDQKSRKVIQHWPFQKAAIGYDGEQVWTQNWRKANAPTFMVHFFYYFVNLPWITQDDNAILSAVKTFKWPGQETELYEVKLTFSEPPGVGKASNDYFVLYINPESHLITGYQYAVGYRPQLDVMNVPKDRDLFGPMWRLITQYENVDGLVFPSAFRTMPEPDERIVGNHIIMNISIDKPFDESKAEQPEDAVTYTGPLTTKY